MSLLIHASIRVQGEPALLEPFRQRVADLLAAEPVAGELDEQLGDDGLHYDLKVAGGIPFPPFVTASQEFPQLKLDVDWINADLGTHGSATLENGRIVTHSSEPLPGAASAPAGMSFVRLHPDGELAVALVAQRVSPDEYRGYAVTARRDTLFRAVRDAGAAHAELFATVGAEPQWREAWSADLKGGTQEFRELDPPLAIAEAEYQEFLDMADVFVAQWIWFGNAPEEDIVLERQRYERAGHPVRDANLKAARIGELESGADGSRHTGRFDADAAWVRDLLEQCWAKP